MNWVDGVHRSLSDRLVSSAPRLHDVPGEHLAEQTDAWVSEKPPPSKWGRFHLDVV